MKIEIQPEQMVALFRSGLIHPSDIKCLDPETKDMLKTLCLKLCSPDNCSKCDAQNQCQTEVDTSLIQNILVQCTDTSINN
jgi:hypothetical protein